MAPRPPFCAILGHFGIFWPFGAFLEGQSRGKIERPTKIGRSRGHKLHLDPFLGAFFGHFEPFWALLGLF